MKVVYNRFPFSVACLTVALAASGALVLAQQPQPLPNMGQQITPEQLDEMAWLYYEPLSRRASIEPGLPELLQGFRQRGLALGVVSNTFIPAKALDRHLSSAGLIDLLPMRVYSCDVRYRKPDRRIFRIALERLGTAAEATMFVGDNLRADIAGANRAGLISVLKDRTGLVRTRFTRPAHRVRALSELTPIVDRYA